MATQEGEKSTGKRMLSIRPMACLLRRMRETSFFQIHGRYRSSRRSNGVHSIDEFTGIRSRSTRERKAHFLVCSEPSHELFLLRTERRFTKDYKLTIGTFLGFETRADV